MKRTRKKKAELGARPVSVSDARQNFSPIIDQLARSPALEVPITVHGKVQAYLISAEHLSELKAEEPGHRYGAQRPPRIRGTMKLVGDIDAALEAAKREHLQHLISEVEDQP